MTEAASFEKLDQAIGTVLDAETTDFFALAEMLGLDPKQDFAGADLSGTDLFRGDLAGTNFAETDLRGANLAYANLQRANLTNAHLGILPSRAKARTGELKNIITQTRTQARSLVSVLTRTLSVGIDSDINLNNVLANDIARARIILAQTLELDHGFALKLDSTLARALSYGRAIAIDHTPEEALSTAQDLVRELELADSLIRSIGGNANLYGVDLTGAVLDGATVEEAIMTGCIGLSKSEIADLKRRGAIFDSSSGDRSEVRVPVPR